MSGSAACAPGSVCRGGSDRWGLKLPLSQFPGRVSCGDSLGRRWATRRSSPRSAALASLSIGVYNWPMFLSELIDLQIRESPTYAPPFSFRLNLPYADPLLKPNLDRRRHSVTTLLQKPLAGPASILQNGAARSQITIRDAEVKRAEIGRIRRLLAHVDCFRLADERAESKEQFSSFLRHALSTAD